MIDILFFAILAFFIFSKLKSQLGNVDEDEQNRAEDRMKKRTRLLEELQGQMRTNQNHMKEAQKVEIKINDSLLTSLDSHSKAQFLAAMKACNITPDFFLNGAKSAFEMVINAFAKSDLETLKFLLADKIYEGFEQSISQRNQANQTLTSNLIAIDEAKITSASMVANVALVTIEFTSKQINYVLDQDENVVEGSKTDITTLTDIWTFKKDVSDNSPNWIIVSTNA